MDESSLTLFPHSQSEKKGEIESFRGIVCCVVRETTTFDDVGDDQVHTLFQPNKQATHLIFYFS